MAFAIVEPLISRQGILEHRIKTGGVLIPVRRDAHIGANLVGSVGHESVPASRISQNQMGIRQGEFTSLLIAVRLLADGLTHEGGGSHRAELSGKYRMDK